MKAAAHAVSSSGACLSACVSVCVSVLLSVAVSAVTVAQEPTDTTRRPQWLPTVTTIADRPEKELFKAKTGVGFVTITGKELAAAPRFFGESDILRAVRLLPGVNARNDFSVGMNVRGGEADQNLVMLDGFPIYNPFHMGGLFGAFVEPMVDGVDFFTGAFPARYGGRLSSVLDVRSRGEPRRGLHGQVDASFIATTIALGSGFQGGQGTWTVAARRTYADKFIDLISDEKLPYHFRDAQAHGRFVAPGGVRVGITGYSNVDDLIGEDDSDFDTGENDRFTLTWGNQLAGLSAEKSFTSNPRLWKLTFGDSAVLAQRVSYSRFFLDMNLFEHVKLNNPVYDTRLQGSLSFYNNRHDRSVGYELGAQRYRYSSNFPAVIYPSDSIINANRSASVFFDDLWRPSHRWLVQAGARYDHVERLGGVLQPRLSVKYFLTPDLAVTGAYGEFAQWAHSLAREDVPIRALDFWVGSDQRAPTSRARHYILGAERWFGGLKALRVETWVKQYPALIEQNPHGRVQVDGDEFIRLRGYSYGGDLMLRQLSNGRFAGWIAYNFSFSSRETESGQRFFPGHDRRHELNVVGSWTGRRWTRSMRFNLATGTPYTENVGEFRRREYDANRRRYDFGANDLSQFIVGPRNAHRLPLAQRLDVSLTRRGDGRGASWSPYFSVMNLYNAKNYFAYIFDYSGVPPERIRLQQLPVFPTLGVSVAW
jgi:hypothetical protein